MPKGFYLDGIILLTLSIAGIIGSLIAHLAVVPSWRARARAMKEVNEDKDEAGQTDSEEVDSDEEKGEESFDESESEDDVEYEDKEDSEDDDEADDAIDIGSHVGLTFDDEEVFGTIIEFDDDEETVTIEEEESGDEITAYQDEMFVPED